MRLAITGAGGFVGSRFLEYNSGKYSFKRIQLRNASAQERDLSKIDAIVHLAGKAHEMKAIDENIYYEVNFELTKSLADDAKKQRVPHFIFISSVKVYGDKNDLFVDEDSVCEPSDAYGKSKLQAENYLRSIQSADFKIGIVRPPLVYGPGVKGNMIRLLKLAEKNIPLPFGGDHNQRSVVFVDNLVELINRVIETQGSGTFLAGDRHPISTGKLLALMRGFMDKRPGLITIPSAGRKLLKTLSPKLFSRLFGSFVVDNERTNRRLEFQPPYSTEYGVREMVDWYMKAGKQGNLPLALNKQ